jgi:hypothetical protein
MPPNEEKRKMADQIQKKREKWLRGKEKDG